MCECTCEVCACVNAHVKFVHVWMHMWSLCMHCAQCVWMCLCVSMGYVLDSIMSSASLSACPVSSPWGDNPNDRTAFAVAPPTTYTGFVFHCSTKASWDSNPEIQHRVILTWGTHTHARTHAHTHTRVRTHPPTHLHTTHTHYHTHALPHTRTHTFTDTVCHCTDCRLTSKH